MATPRYPSTLPIPKSVQLTAANQQLSGPEEGPYETRRRSMVPGATVSATFKYLKFQYKIFVEWYKSDLKYGHKWFVLYLPSAAGIVPHVVRFKEPYQAALHGHTYWEVSANLEVRERIMDNGLSVTSRPYSIQAEDVMQLDARDVLFRSHRFSPEQLQFSAAIQLIELRSTIQYITDATHAIQFAASAQSIALRDVRIVLPLPAESIAFSASALGITIDEVVVRTSRTEELQFSASMQAMALS